MLQIKQRLIEVDAAETYHAADVTNLVINSLKDAKGSVLVVIKNAERLTGDAFALLYAYANSSLPFTANVVLVSSDPSKIFPPLRQIARTAP